MHRHQVGFGTPLGRSKAKIFRVHFNLATDTRMYRTVDDELPLKQFADEVFAEMLETAKIGIDDNEQRNQQQPDKAGDGIKCK